MIFHETRIPAKDALLQGRLYLPAHSSSIQQHPAIIMTHGFSALYSHDLDRYAAYFSTAGFATLIYNHRGFGLSSGPLQAIDPYQQIQDYRHALHFLHQHSAIDKQRIGLWGTSYSAGHVLSLAASEIETPCIVAQTPFLDGKANQRHQNSAPFALQRPYPSHLPVVSNNNTAAILPGIAAYEYMTKETLWKNTVTFGSLRNALRYTPQQHLNSIHSPTLMIIAKQDEITPPALQHQGFDAINTRNKLKIILDGNHFSPYQQYFHTTASACCDWFFRYLT